MISIFIAYAHEDSTFVDGLLKHLGGIAKHGLVKLFHDRDLAAGSEWKPAIEAQLRCADVVLLLISPSFIESKHCDREVEIAMERHAAGDAVVVPVILRQCDWDFEPYHALNALPRGGRPIESFGKWNRAFNEIAHAIRQLVFDRMVQEPEPAVELPRPTDPTEEETMQTDVEEVIGFDLGHGESAVARMSLAARAVPQIVAIHGERSQITAIGMLDGRPVVGELVVQSPRVTAPRIGFKVRPPGTAESRAALTDFVREYDALLTSTKQILGGERTQYFVGRPSAWTREEADSYRDLLQTVLSKVTVVPESRAALIEAKEKYGLAPEQVRASILIIDFGSSTIDVSLVFGGIQDESLDLGIDLGGHLIEKEILRRAIARDRRREEIVAFFVAEGGEGHRRVSETRCRELKERYWKYEAISRGERLRSRIDIANGAFEIEAHLDSAEVASILAEPLPELDGASWEGTLCGFFDEMTTTLDNRGRTPEVVILTGGPSAMSFVRELCRSRFPEAELVWCTPTEETVALGLARWGSIQLRTNAFAEEVRAFCNDVVPGIVQRRMDALRDAMAAELAQRLAAEVVGPTLRDWRRDAIPTLRAMKTELVERTLAWLRSDAGIETIRKACTAALALITEEVNRGTFGICIKHDIPSASMQIDLTVPVGDAIEFRIETPFETIMGIAGMITGVALVVLTAIAKGMLATATLTVGPPGWIVAALLAAWAAVFGLMTLDEKLEGFDMPVFLRTTFLSDDKLNRVVSEAVPKIQETVKTAIGDPEMERIRSAISTQVSGFLTARANDVKWIIG